MAACNGFHAHLCDPSPSLASVPDDQGPWLPILDTARRTDVRVTERRESGTSTFIAASTLGVFTACSVNVGLKHVKVTRPCTHTGHIGMAFLYHSSTSR